MMETANDEKRYPSTERKSDFHHSLIALCGEVIKSVMAHSLMLSRV